MGMTSDSSWLRGAVLLWLHRALQAPYPQSSSTLLKSPWLTSVNACRWSLAPAYGPPVRLLMPCRSLLQMVMPHVAAGTCHGPHSCSHHLAAC